MMMTKPVLAPLFVGMLLAAFPVLLPAQASAQVNLTGTSALTIVVNPPHPTPVSIVKLTAQSPLLDLADSDVEWTVNGKPAGSGQSIGQPMQLEGAGHRNRRQRFCFGRKRERFRAAFHRPDFHRPALRSRFIRAAVLPRPSAPDLGLDDPSARDTALHRPGWDCHCAVRYRFHLEIEQRRRRSAIRCRRIFRPIPCGDPHVLTQTGSRCDAQTPDGSISGEASISLRTQNPDLVLYEDSPLFGIMYHRALGQSAIASEAETSFAAVPYFASAVSANDPSLAYAWTVGGSPVATDSQDPSEITINAQSSGVAQIGLALTEPSDPFFSASGAWAISFANASGGSLENNPFQSQ